MTIHLYQHTSIDDFEPGEWDGLLNDGAFYGSHSWLKAVEHHDTFKASYIAARDDTGGLLGALPLYTTQRAPAEYRFDPSVQFQDAVSGNFFPATIVGLRAGYSTEFPLDQKLPRDVTEAVLKSLVNACVQPTWDNPGSFSLLYVKSATVARLVAASGLASCQVFNAPYATLDIRWNDFGEYLSSHTSSRRRWMKQDIAAFERSGCELSYTLLSDCYAECAPLSAGVQRRYGAMDSVSVIEERLAAQAAAMGESAICILCRLHGDLVGFSLLYRWSDELYVRIVGFDYERLPPDSRVYFTVMFYEPIRYAIANRIRIIDYGLEVGDAKVGRGCVLSPRWSVTYNSASPEAQDKANKQNMVAREQMIARYGRYSGALPSALWDSPAWEQLGTLGKANLERWHGSCPITYSTILVAGSKSSSTMRASTLSGQRSCAFRAAGQLHWVILTASPRWNTLRRYGWTCGPPASHGNWTRLRYLVAARAVIALVPLLEYRCLPPSSAAWALSVGGLGQITGRSSYRLLGRKLSVRSRTLVVLLVGTASNAAFPFVGGLDIVLRAR
jgi:uncharacterized protein